MAFLVPMLLVGIGQWVIIDTKVFDLTKFVRLHPGGKEVLIDADVGEPPSSPLQTHSTYSFSL